MLTLDCERKIQIPQTALDALGWRANQPLTYTILGSRITLYPAIRPSNDIPPCGQSVHSLLRLVFSGMERTPRHA